MRIHDLTAAILAMPAIDTAEEAVRLSKFAITLQKQPTFLKVYHRELSYTVGHWGGWEGHYWLVEDTTGIIFRVSSVRELRDLIKLCSASVYEPDQIKP
jgi:hypothetical protein